MAFSVPQVTPKFKGAGIDGGPEAKWKSVRNIGQSPFMNLLSGRGEAGLPLYKDKPQMGMTVREQRRRRQVLWGLIFVIFGASLYWVGAQYRAEQEREAGNAALMGPSGQSNGLWDHRQQTVRQVFIDSWAAYEKHGWGYDEYRPLSKKGRQMVPPTGLGWIIVDSLDTLILMDLPDQLGRAREWISSTLTYDLSSSVNTFETTIRVLGGLLSAHYLTSTREWAGSTASSRSGRGSGDELYLNKAADLASRLSGAYDSKSGIPWASVNLRSGQGIKSHTDGGASSTAEAGTVQLEMKYLANLTGEAEYWHRAERAIKAIDDAGAEDGLVPIFIYPEDGTFRGSNVRLGSRGDSYYEYLIKQYLQTSGEEPIYREMWQEALEGIRKHLLVYSSKTNLIVPVERPHGLNGAPDPKMDHLVCFLPGTIALSVTGGKTIEQMKSDGKWTDQAEEDMLLARELMKTCWGMYSFPPSGLAAEITYFHVDNPVRMVYPSGTSSRIDRKILSSSDPFTSDQSKDAKWRSDFEIKPLDRHNLQRPETIESLFTLYRITKDDQYRHWAWKIFQSFTTHTAIKDGKDGYTSLKDVMVLPVVQADNMESFWLAETLKYLYLLFGPDDVFELDKFVFSTEAHPFPRFSLGRLFSTGWTRKPKTDSTA